MIKSNINDMVSLILMKINEQHESPEVGSLQPEVEPHQPEDDFIYIGTEKDLEIFLRSISNGENDNIEGTDIELDEMARGSKFPITVLDCPMRIPIEEIHLGDDKPNAYIPPIKCLDPETGEYSETHIIGTEIMEYPSGWKFLRFQNYYSSTNVDKENVAVKAYVAISADDLKNQKYINCYYSGLPRGKRYDNPISRDVSMKLSIAPDNETPEEREIRLNKLKKLNEGTAKRFGIFPAINQSIGDPKFLHHLDMCLIPETWATVPRTEHVTNVIKLYKFGGDGAEIDADFVSVKDFEDIDKAIDATLDASDSFMQRKISNKIPRQNAGYIYTKGGRWDASQRVLDKHRFEAEGGKTRVYKLNPKNIQEGNVTLNIRSALHLLGDIIGDEYVLSATFTAFLNGRDVETNEGIKIGELFKPVKVELSKPIPENEDGEPYTTETFSLTNNTDFFIDQGRTSKDVKRTGLIPNLLNMLKEEIMEQVNPNQVLGKMIDLMSDRVE